MRLRNGGLNRDFVIRNGTPYPFDSVDLEFRPYTAESVVAKRGIMKIEYPSNTQAKKLFALLEEHAKVSVFTSVMLIRDE
jgi:hypothetical protein